MIDLHCHIIPGVDDGPASLEETQAMLAMAAADGIEAISATPHCDLRYPYDPERCRAELARIQRSCPGVPRLHLGCELHLTPENIDRVLKTPVDFTLNGGDCLLVELPDRITPAALDAAFSAFQDSGLRTVIAHPERNLYLQKNPRHVRALVESGCYFQITAQSLAGAFGAPAERFARAFLKERLVHFIATDSHGPERRRPLLSRAFTETERRWGQATAKLLCVANPRAALESGPIQHMGAGSKLFFSLFRTSYGLANQ